jgi:plastocyanin
MLTRGFEMRRLLAVIVAAVLVAGLATSAVAGTAPVKNAKVNDLNMAFAPGKLTVKKGTKVVWKWVNLAGIKHDVAVAKGPAKFKSKLIAKGTFSHLFTRKGTYLLHCTIHPWMTETVVVK